LNFSVCGIIGWFEPVILKELDEERIPMQISEKFYVADDTKDRLNNRLKLLCLKEDKQLTVFERDWINDVL
jgi:hypothetical protein